MFVAALFMIATSENNPESENKCPKKEEQINRIYIYICIKIYAYPQKNTTLYYYKQR